MHTAGLQVEFKGLSILLPTHGVLTEDVSLMRLNSLARMGTAAELLSGLGQIIFQWKSQQAYLSKVPEVTHSSQGCWKPGHAW